MNRTIILALAVVTALVTSGCIGAGELPDEFEEYESAYGFSIDLPEGWTMEMTDASPREMRMEVYESDRAKNPLIMIRADLTRNPDVEGSVEEWSELLEESWDIIAKGRAEIGGKDTYRMVRTSKDGDYEITDVVWVEDRPGEDLFMMLSFRRERSSFDDTDWDRFISRIVGSVELEG
jgi:hypothetical protein